MVRQVFRGFHGTTFSVKARPSSKVSRLERKVKNLSKTVRLRKPEQKYADQSELNANSSYDGSLRTIVAAPAQGSSDTTRVGDSYRPLNIKLGMAFNAAVTTAIRVIVFIDKRNFSTAVTDVLESGFIGAANGLNTINAPFVHDYLSKYTILMDRVYRFDVTGDNINTFKKTFNLKGHTVEMLAGTTTIVRNAVKMIYITGLVAGATPNVNWHARTNYIDQ